MLALWGRGQDRTGKESGVGNRVFVTGGAGFIGSCFVRHALEAGYEVVTFDALTYAGNLANLTDVARHPRHRFVRGDVTDAAGVREAMASCRLVVNFAAESHVDRSIEAPGVFLQTNVVGVGVLLDAARSLGVERFLQVSTDEVYGSLGAEGLFTEDSPLAPNSPYAASKAAADLLVRSYVHTFGLPCLITRCSNNYGPRQFPEKLIPLMVLNALEGLPLPVYGDGGNVRDWIHVDDHCRALLAVLERGRPGVVYNVGGGAERTNLDVVRAILRLLDAPESLMRFVADRPGHDRRYAIDASRLRDELGVSPRRSFEEGLEDTLAWYRENRAWCEAIRNGSYRDYYERMYGRRLAGARLPDEEAKA